METTTTRGQEDKSHYLPLHLLNILPFPYSDPNAGWSRAYELIPAAELAVEHANMAPGLLTNHSLHLVTLESEPCGFSFINDGLVNPFAAVFDERNALNVVGMSGLFCSTVTDKVTGVFSFPRVPFLQLAGSNTPLHRDSKRFPWLVHLVSSSAVFNDALIAMMRTFRWQRISIVYRSLGVFFASDAADFIERADSAGFEVVTAIALSDSQGRGDVFSLLTDAGARIVYITAPNSKCAAVLCEAYKNRAFYPNYAYIFHDKTVAEIVARADGTDCTEADLMETMEGVFFIQYDLKANEDATLVSALTYREFYQEYVKRLDKLESSTGMTLDRENAYANVMYDQVWAFALALNASIKQIESSDIDLADIQVDQYSLIAETLRSEIQKISFQGASGRINFNTENEQISVVRVFQVINNTEELIGEFNGDHKNRTCLGKDLDLDYSLCLLNGLVDPPPDSFKTKTILLPTWASYLIGITTAVFLIGTTVNFIFLYVVFRKRPEVKASSVSLSIVMFIGCYLSFVGMLMRNVSRSYDISNADTFEVICNIEVWFSGIGIDLVLSALLLRLARVRQIFNSFGKVNKLWNDKCLILCVPAICLVDVIILVVWTVTDSNRKLTTTSYKPTTIPPHYESVSFCSSSHWVTWLLLIHSYNGIVMVLVVIMAVLTRKIRLSNFKDTKKINAFVAATSATILLSLPLWFILERELQDFIGGHFVYCFGLACSSVYCQLFIFLPLVVKVVKGKKKTKKATNILQVYERQERQYSMFL